jgi:hypothetical protein
MKFELVVPIPLSTNGLDLPLFIGLTSSVNLSGLWVPISLLKGL